MLAIELPRPPVPGCPPKHVWELVDLDAKLEQRAQLPGAFGYDRIAHDLDVAREAGLGVEHRLASALPASWMVNTKASSPVFYAWLQPAPREHFAELCTLLEGGPEAWVKKSAEDRARVDELARSLTETAASAAKGSAAAAGVCALSKVLALLVPETVPLLDDAAVHLLTGEVALPRTAETPTAGPEHLLSALDAFCSGVGAHQKKLMAAAAQHPELMLRHPAQVLDRALWVDSWGFQHFGYRRVEGPTSVRIER